jgi:hypothetical protein
LTIPSLKNLTTAMLLLTFMMIVTTARVEEVSPLGECVLLLLSHVPSPT